MICHNYFIMDRSYISKGLSHRFNGKTPYIRKHMYEYMEGLGTRSTTCPTKIYPPEHFTCLLDESDTCIAVPVTGRKDSLWHALLHMLYPIYRDVNWKTKTDLVEKFIEQIDYEKITYFNKDPILSSTALTGDIVSLREVPTNELYYYLASLFNINIIIVDTTKTTCHFREPTPFLEKPTVILYQDDLLVFYPLMINDSFIVSMEKKLSHIITEKDNSVLKKYVKEKKNPKLFSLVKKK